MVTFMTKINSNNMQLNNQLISIYAKNLFIQKALNVSDSVLKRDLS